MNKIGRLFIYVRK